MSERNDRFNRDLRSLDGLTESVDISKCQEFSDRGKGAMRIRNFEEMSEREILKADKQNKGRIGVRIQFAYRTLRLSGHACMIPTLQKIIKNGSNREKSIAEIQFERQITRRTAQNLYFSHRQELLRIFTVKRGYLEKS